jgi:AcrR family transcriptional regulator
MTTKRFENLDPERRKKILEAAQEDFIRSGYEGASLNTIAREAGISKGSLYYYFEDKVDLYLTVLQKNVDDILEELGDFGIGQFSDDFWGNLEKYMRKAIKIAKERPELFTLTRGLINLYYSPNRTDRVIKFFNYSKNIFAKILKHGLDKGVIRTDVPFGLLVNMIHGFHEAFDHWVLDHIEEISEDEYERLMRIFLNILKDISSAKPSLQQEES